MPAGDFETPLKKGNPGVYNSRELFSSSFLILGESLTWIRS